jgi:hypothetical protein
VHLTPEEFVDAAEGTRSEPSFAHLNDCEACRRELAALRAAMSDAAEGEVPEPSPLFWTNLSTRVNAAIDADRSSRRWWAWLRPSILVPLSAAALLVLIVAIAPRLGMDHAAAPAARYTTSVPPAVQPATAQPADAVDLANDPLLSMVSDLTATMDLDDASAAGFTEPDSAEYALNHMSDDELRSLKQLLQAEMSRKGA